MEHVAAVAPHPWGVTTQKGNKLYVHILDLKDKALFLPLTGKNVKKAVGLKISLRFASKYESRDGSCSNLPKFRKILTMW